MWHDVDETCWCLLPVVSNIKQKLCTNEPACSEGKKQPTHGTFCCGSQVARCDSRNSNEMQPVLLTRSWKSRKPIHVFLSFQHTPQFYITIAQTSIPNHSLSNLHISVGADRRRASGDQLWGTPFTELQAEATTLASLTFGIKPRSQAVK